MTGMELLLCCLRATANLVAPASCSSLALRRRGRRRRRSISLRLANFGNWPRSSRHKAFEGFRDRTRCWSAPGQLRCSRFRWSTSATASSSGSDWRLTKEAARWSKISIQPPVGGHPVIDHAIWRALVVAICPATSCRLDMIGLDDLRSKSRASQLAPSCARTRMRTAHASLPNRQQLPRASRRKRGPRHAGRRRASPGRVVRAGRGRDTGGRRR